MITLFIILGAVLLLISLFLAWTDKKGLFEPSDFRTIAIVISFAFGFSFLFFSAGKESSDRSYINSLNGNNPYRKEYIYKQIDSTYVIVDSVYVKKEEK